MHIFRHGETVWNEQGLMQGHLDSPLSELGKSRARHVAKQIKGVPFDIAYSSSSGRALETTSLLLGDRKVPIVALDELREINLGEWEGRPKSEVMDEDVERYRKFWDAPAEYESVVGESFHSMWDRVTETVIAILDKEVNKTILVVSHAASVKAIMSYFTERAIEEIWNPLFAENLSHSILVKEGSGVVVQKFCGEQWGGV